MRGFDPSRGLLVVVLALTGCAQLSGLSDLRLDYCEGKAVQTSESGSTVSTTCTDFDGSGYGNWLVDRGTTPGEQLGELGYDGASYISAPRSLLSTAILEKTRARLFVKLTSTDVAAKLELVIDPRIPQIASPTPPQEQPPYVSLAEIVCCPTPPPEPPLPNAPPPPPCDGVYLRAKPGNDGTHLAFVRGRLPDTAPEIFIEPTPVTPGFRAVSIDVTWGDFKNPATAVVKLGDHPAVTVQLKELCYPDAMSSRMPTSANIGVSVVRTKLTEPAQAAYDNVFLTVTSKLPG